MLNLLHHYILLLLFLHVASSFANIQSGTTPGTTPGNAVNSSAIKINDNDKVDDEILYSQEVLIGRLYSALGQLRSENTALRDKLAMLESSSASIGGAISSSNAALKTEVFRLVRKTQEKRDEKHQEQENNDKENNENNDANENGKEQRSNTGIGQWTRPQQVNVVCKDAAAISVIPLAEEDRGNDECLILQFKAPDLDSRFVMYCDSVSGQ